MFQSCRKRYQFANWCCLIPTILAFAPTLHAQPAIVRVDSTSTASTPDGSSWSLAFPKLRDGLVEADALVASQLFDWVEVWVANGTYFPDEHGGFDTNTRSEYFQMKEGVRIYAGFHGNPNGETLLNQRNPYTNICILSGDIDQDNVLDAENSYHVVYAEGIHAESSILDGFTIKHGNAIGSAYGGGGLLLRPSQVAIAGCSAKIVRCTFEHNQGNLGGAVASENIQGGNPEFFNCIFRNNEAITVSISIGKGGAIYGTGSAGCEEEGLAPVIHLTNCLFHDNTFDSEFGSGGAIYYDDGKIDAINCTIVNNSTGVRHFSETCARGNIKNSIVFGNGNETGSDQIFGNVAVDYSCVQSNPVWQTGTGNINNDPDFVDPDAIWQLNSTSPCINIGSDVPLQGDDDDLDQDGELYEAVPDLEREKRAVGSVDMGSYERQQSCAADVHPTPPFGDGDVDVDDLLVVINNWGNCPAGFGYCPGDIVISVGHTVDVDDLLAVINGWGDECGTMNTEMPQSIQECWNECNSRCPGDIECFNACFDGCVEALCKAEIIECDE